MPRIKTVTRTTAAQELINENVPLESRSPSRTPTQSPARRKEAASPRTRSALSRHVAPVDQMDFQSEEMQHSPPKQRKIDDSEVKSKKGRNLQLQLAPPVVEDVHMEENHFSPSSAGIQQDLSDRITKMIVSQLGIRKRKYKGNKDHVSDEEMEEDFDSGPQAKRSLCEIDYARLTQMMDHMDVEQMASCIPKVKDYFEQWQRLLAAKNYNILVTGKGSKMKIINKFVEQPGLNMEILCVNGASLTTSTKSIFSMIEKELKIKMPTRRSMTPIQFARELGETIAKGKRHILLIIHSLDGPNLRDPTQQSILASFVNAAKGKLNLIASADHVNHGLLWNNEVRCAYSFVPYTVDTYMSYREEIAASSPGLLGMQAKSAADSHTFASLEVFWQALPATAQKELFLLTTMSLDNADGVVELNYLFDRARRLMITTSRTSLEQHLTEFKDHSLISMNHGLIRLIIDRDLLLNFMNSKGMEVDD